MTTFALVGDGKWGKNYIQTIKLLPNCILPAEYIVTTDYRRLLLHKNIDGVIIATPSTTHFSIAKEFLQNKFNVLIEKPLTTNYQDALELEKLAKKNKSVAMVGHIFLYHPAIIQMRQLVNKLGKIKLILSEGMNWGPIRDDVSSLWDWIPHDIATVLYLLGTPPRSIAAWGINCLRPETKLYDMCFVKLKFFKDLYVIIQVGWLSPIKKRSTTIVGEKGVLIFDDLSEKKLIFISTEKNKTEYPEYDFEFPLKVQITEFIDCIQNKHTPKTPLSDGAKIVKIIEKVEESISLNGKEISF